MKPPRWLQHEMGGGSSQHLALHEQLWLAPPGLPVLTGALWQVWAYVAVLAAVAGWLWRRGGGGPDIVGVLNGAGLVLWLAALWLWPAWQTLLERQQRHLLAPVQPWIPRLHNATNLTGGALGIGLAASGVLLGYNARASVANVVSADGMIFNAPLGALVMLALLLAAPALLLLSVAVLHAARALCGARLGLLVWLAIVLAANLHFVAGLVPWAVPTAPGDYVQWAVRMLQATPERSDYLSEILRRVVGTPALVLLGAAVLALLVQRLPLRRQQPISPVWLAATAGVAVATLRTLVLTWQWVGQPAVQYPGQWQAVLWAGLLACWLALLAYPGDRTARPRGSSQDALWLVYGVAVWVCLTLPNRLADQVARGEVLAYSLPVLAILLLGAALLRRSARWYSLAPAAAAMVQLGVALLLLPVGAGNLPLALSICADLGRGLLNPLSAGDAAAVVAAALAMAIWCWPWSRRPLAKAEATSEPA